MNYKINFDKRILLIFWIILLISCDEQKAKSGYQDESRLSLIYLDSIRAANKVAKTVVYNSKDEILRTEYSDSLGKIYKTTLSHSESEQQEIVISYYKTGEIKRIESYQFRKLTSTIEIEHPKENLIYVTDNNIIEDKLFITKTYLNTAGNDSLMRDYQDEQFNSTTLFEYDDQNRVITTSNFDINNKWKYTVIISYPDYNTVVKRIDTWDDDVTVTEEYDSNRILIRTTSEFNDGYIICDSISFGKKLPKEKFQLSRFKTAITKTLLESYRYYQDDDIPIRN